MPSDQRNSQGTKNVKFVKRKQSKSPPRSRDNQKDIIKKLILRTEPNGPDEFGSKDDKIINVTGGDYRKFEMEFNIGSHLGHSQSPQEHKNYGSNFNNPFD